jgi:hypothetical protein
LADPDPKTVPLSRTAAVHEIWGSTSTRYLRVSTYPIFDSWLILHLKKKKNDIEISSPGAQKQLQPAESRGTNPAPASSHQ